MKNKFQIEIIKLLNKLFKNLIFPTKYNSLKKKNYINGLLEWDEETNALLNININKDINLENLLFVDNQKSILINNTKLFLEKGVANNVLLWGSRGTGKSSLVIATYNFFKRNYSFSMIEIKFFQIQYLPKILRILEKKKKKIIIYCDDFSFENNDKNFILFKNTLEGTLRKNQNIIFYVTSNYRHLVRNMKNYHVDEINKKDNIENFISLSDRFGVWLGFHNFNQENFLKIVFFYAKFFKLNLSQKTLKNKAIKWSLLRGSYSGREAVNLVRFLLSKEN